MIRPVHSLMVLVVDLYGFEFYFSLLCSLYQNLVRFCLFFFFSVCLAFYKHGVSQPTVSKSYVTVGCDLYCAAFVQQIENYFIVMSLSVYLHK